jgi:hypothetical protein
MGYPGQKDQDGPHSEKQTKRKMKGIKKRRKDEREKHPPGSGGKKKGREKGLTEGEDEVDRLYQHPFFGLQ